MSILVNNEDAICDDIDLVIEQRALPQEERLAFVGGFLHVIPPPKNSAVTWVVWFNGDIDFDGVCVGVGQDREMAMKDARQTLVNAIHVIDRPF